MDEYTLVMAEALARSNAEAGVRAVVARIPIQPLNYDGSCTRCSEPIGPGRVAFGAVTCLPCQRHKELVTSNPR
jgi:RNA polymerase-binding transcription factor DksA